MTNTTSLLTPIPIDPLQGQPIMKAALCLRVKIRTLNIERTVRDAAYQVDGTDKEMTRLVKDIVDRKDLRYIQRNNSRIDATLNRLALPAPFQRGWWLIPRELVTEVVKELDRLIGERLKLVEELKINYLKICESARERLGPIWRASDYPSLEALDAIFSIQYRFMSFAVPGTLADISTDILAKEQQKAYAEAQSALAEIMVGFRSGMLDLIVRTTEALKPGKDGKAKGFHESTVANLLTFLRLFEAKNSVVQDPELPRLAEAARKLLSGGNAASVTASLKQNASLRDQVRTGLQGIGDELTKLTITKPSINLQFLGDLEA
mgnify:CR=1 FL=1